MHRSIERNGADGAATAALEAGEPAGTLLATLKRPASPEPLEAQLRRYIVEHGLAPGDRLPSEADLAAVLGCSRLVVREALSSLAALGLVEARVGSGWYVRRFEVSLAARTIARSLAFYPQALIDLLAVRRSVEADLVRELAGRLAPADLTALDELVDRMRWRAARGQAFPAEDGEFHRRVAAASGNQIALALVDLFWAIKEALYLNGLTPISPAEAREVAAAHGELLECMRCGDGEAAAWRLRTHHDEAQRRFAAWSRGRPRPDGDGPGAAVAAAVQAALLWPGSGGTG